MCYRCSLLFSPFAHHINYRAGYKLTVIDSADKDWWKGKCLGSVGVFPANYVTKLNPGEKPLQVTQTVQINPVSLQEPPIKLLRDQVCNTYVVTQRSAQGKQRAGLDMYTVFPRI